MTCLLQTIPGCTSLFGFLYQYQFWGPTILRFGLGAVFLVHGYQKLFGGIDSTAQFFTSIGIKPGRAFAYLVGLVEFVGALLLFVGLFVQPVSILLAIIMIVAILKVKFSKGFAGGYDFEFALLIMALALLVLGPGNYSLDLPF
jgi:uncharacterized membrane protein YphA (DoxX/SURF4 family)